MYCSKAALSMLFLKMTVYIDTAWRKKNEIDIFEQYFKERNIYMREGVIMYTQYGTILTWGLFYV